MLVCPSLNFCVVVGVLSSLRISSIIKLQGFHLIFFNNYAAASFAIICQSKKSKILFRMKEFDKMLWSTILQSANSDKFVCLKAKPMLIGVKSCFSISRNVLHMYIAVARVYQPFNRLLLLGNIALRIV